MHFYEKNIVEIKNEYTKFLINLLKPFIYEGFYGIYLQAVKVEDDYIQKEKINPKIKNPGIFKIFQTLLRDIPNLGDNFIEEETKRIKERSKSSDFFDDLVRAVIKSFIVLLTFNVSQKKCQVVKEKFHESINIRHFIHKCYIECARIIFNNPELFWHKFPTIEAKKNKQEVYNLISDGISEAIRKMLPVRLILQEYLSKDYINTSDEYDKITNSTTDKKNTKDNYSYIKNNIRRDLYGQGLNAFQEEDSTPKTESGIKSNNISSNKNLSDNSQSTTSNVIIDSDSDTTNTEDRDSLHEIGNKVNNLDFDKLLLANHNEQNKNSLMSENNSHSNTNNKMQVLSEKKVKSDNNSINKILSENVPVDKNSSDKVQENKVQENKVQENKPPELKVLPVTVNQKDRDNFFKSYLK